MSPRIHPIGSQHDGAGSLYASPMIEAACSVSVDCMLAGTGGKAMQFKIPKLVIPPYFKLGVALGGDLVNLFGYMALVFFVVTKWLNDLGKVTGGVSDKAPGLAVQTAGCGGPAPSELGLLQVEEGPCPGITAHELRLVALAVYTEARGVGPIGSASGWRAVAWVVRNRYENGGFGNTYPQVVVGGFSGVQDRLSQARAELTRRGVPAGDQTQDALVRQAVRTIEAAGDHIALLDSQGNVRYVGSAWEMARLVLCDLTGEPDPIEGRLYFLDSSVARPGGRRPTTNECPLVIQDPVTGQTLWFYYDSPYPRTPGTEPCRPWET